MTATMNAPRERLSKPSHLTPNEFAAMRALLSEALLKHQWQHQQHQVRLSELTGDGATDGREEVNSALHRAHDTIKAIEDALARIGDGTYGVCESCEIPIPSERLEAIPHVRYCVACPRTFPYRR